MPKIDDPCLCHNNTECSGDFNIADTVINRYHQQNEVKIEMDEDDDPVYHKWKMNPTKNEILYDMMYSIIEYGCRWLEEYANDHINEYIMQRDLLRKFGQEKRAMDALKKNFSTDIKFMFNK